MRFYLFQIKMYFVRIFKRIFEFFGVALLSKPGLNGIDNKLEQYLGYSNGFFIEVGGNDGFTQSNTYYLERFKNWSGVLVEGIPELYNKCKEERSQSKVYNFALVSKDYNEPYVEMHFANLMSVVDGSLVSDEEQRKHIENGIKVQDLKQAYSIQVSARTLESILDELEEPVYIDFFSLDVEGYELEVLKGLNIQKYQPKYILVEARNFEDIRVFLSDKYDVVEQLTFHDYLFMLKSH